MFAIINCSQHSGCIDMPHGTGPSARLLPVPICAPRMRGERMLYAMQMLDADAPMQPLPQTTGGRPECLPAPNEI